MEFRKHHPDIKAIEKVVLPEPQKVMVNQTPVFIFPSEENILKLKIIFKAGTWFQNKPLQAYFTNKMLCEGTAGFNSRKIAEKIDYYGAKLSLVAEEDWASLTLFVSVNNFENILPVLAEMILMPAFPEKEFSIQKDITFQNFVINNEKVATLARNYFLEVLYGSSNYYGYRTKNEDFDTLHIHDLRTFHEEYYSLSDAMIIVSGKIGALEIKLMEKYLLADSIASRKSKSKKRPFQPEENKKLHIVRKNALQTGIRIGKTLFNRTHADDLGFRFLNVVLGGYFGSRLMSNIREDKGYTYGIYSGLVSLQNSGYFSVFAEVGTPVYEKAVQEVYKEIEELQNNKIKEKELETVRNYILGNFLRNSDGALNFSGIFENALLYGYDIDYFNKYLDTMQTINADTLLSLAQKYLAPLSMYEVTVG